MAIRIYVKTVITDPFMLLPAQSKTNLKGTSGFSESSWVLKISKEGDLLLSEPNVGFGERGSHLVCRHSLSCRLYSVFLSAKVGCEWRRGKNLRYRWYLRYRCTRFMQ